MKKVSANLVLAVMWKGICQLLGWFFGLFGYNQMCLGAVCYQRSNYYGILCTCHYLCGC